MLNTLNDTYILQECQFVHILLSTTVKQCYWHLKTVSKDSST